MLRASSDQVIDDQFGPPTTDIFESLSDSSLPSPNLNDDDDDTPEVNTDSVAPNNEAADMSPPFEPKPGMQLDEERCPQYLTKLGVSGLSSGKKPEDVVNRVLVENYERCRPAMDRSQVNKLVYSLVPKIAPQSSGKRKSNKSLIMSAEQWLEYRSEESTESILVGSPGQAIIRLGTKNLIEAPEKAFKTTMALRLAMGLSTGQTVFAPLPVAKPASVLYLHGELTPDEIKDRTRSALTGLKRPLSNFHQGKDIDAHFIDKEGQGAIRALLQKDKPQVLVLDPWQSFISGYDENVFKDVSTATRFLDRIIEEFSVTIILVIHQGKDPSRGHRGHLDLSRLA